MRDEQSHTSAHFVVNAPISLVPKNAKHRGACRGLVKRDIQHVHNALWSSPFSISPGFQEFVVRQNVPNRDGLSNFSKIVTDRERVQFYILVEVELLVMRLYADMICNVAGLAGSIL